MGQFFQNNQQIKKWDELKTEFDLIEKKFFFQCSDQSCCPKFVESNSAKLHWKYEQSSYPGSSFDEKT